MHAYYSDSSLLAQNLIYYFNNCTILKFVDQGIDPNRLTTKGFGITKSAASNKTKEGRAKNRRVELTPVQ
jgi:OOP family OmpA-OmpF porin